MKKFLGTLILIVAIVASVSLSYVWVTRTSIVASTLSDILKMPVTIRDITIREKQIIVSELEVFNPPGHGLRKAFIADEIIIDLAIADLMSNPLVVERVNIRDSVIGIEMYSMNGEKNNWAEVLEAIPNEPPPGTKGREYIIHNLVLDNFQIEARNKFVVKATIRPPAIKHVEFQDVGTGNPLGRDQIVELIASAILTEVRKHPGLGNILKEVQMLPVKALKGLIKPFGFTTTDTGGEGQNNPSAGNPVAEFGDFLERVFGDAEAPEE